MSEAEAKLGRRGRKPYWALPNSEQNDKSEKYHFFSIRDIKNIDFDVEDKFEVMADNQLWTGFYGKLVW